jgi:hypothetical protein
LEIPGTPFQSGLPQTGIMSPEYRNSGIESTLGARSGVKAEGWRIPSGLRLHYANNYPRITFPGKETCLSSTAPPLSMNG